MKPVLNVLRTSRLPILQQLLLEESILRGTKDNWLIINDGAFLPAIVMGISGRPNELINVPEAKEAGIQIIKRFTGGGTVVVDGDTLFATFIIEGSVLPHVDCYPQPIMKWTETVYQHVFSQYGSFKLRENDYVFDERKFGGNAQAITGKRWLHHTSFLWDFQPERMRLLKQPPKAPEYRKGRTHGDFIIRLKDYVQHRKEVVDSMLLAACKMNFTVKERSIEEASNALRAHTMHGTRLVQL